MTCLRLHGKYLRQVEKWWFKENETFITSSFFKAVHSKESNYLAVLKGWCHEGCSSIPERWKLPVTESKKGLQPGKEKKEELGLESSFLFSSQGKFVSLKSTLAELWHWMCLSWCDSAAAKFQLQSGESRAGWFIVFIHADTPAVAMAGGSWPAPSCCLAERQLQPCLNHKFCGCWNGMKLRSVVQSSTLQLSQVNATCLEESRQCGFTPSDRGDEVTS